MRLSRVVARSGLSEPDAMAWVIRETARRMAVRSGRGPRRVPGIGRTLWMRRVRRLSCLWGRHRGEPVTATERQVVPFFLIPEHNFACISLLLAPMGC
jgi:hypothetical protein